jgi:hypothetical protein
MARVLRPNRGVPLLRRAVVVVFIVAAAVFVLGGLVTIGSQTGGGVMMLGLAVLFSYCAWSLRRTSHRRQRGLTIVVSANRLKLSREGQTLDVIAKADVGLIVLHAISGYGAPGLVDFRIYRPDQSLIGQWDTEWSMAGPIRSIRAFRHYDYPWILHDTGAMIWNDKFHSNSAPSWAGQVVGA